MKCPFCGHRDNKVVDSRSSADAQAVRRRRECLKCDRRFTTYEYIEEKALYVIKKDGRRERYDRKKIRTGIEKACEKRPISSAKIGELVAFIERQMYRRFDKEVPSKFLGELIMGKLAQLDEVAYVRFASVYRQFKDVNHFMSELKGFLKKAGR